MIDKLTVHKTDSLVWVKDVTGDDIDQWSLMPEATRKDVNTTRARIYRDTTKAPSLKTKRPVPLVKWQFSVFDPATGVSRSHGTTPSKVTAMAAAEKGALAYSPGGLSVRNPLTSTVRHWKTSDLG